MPDSTLLELQQKLKQSQLLMMSAQMQQALHLMQLPILELKAAIEAQITQNPLVEFDTDDEEDLEEEGDAEDTEDSSLLEKSLAFREDDYEILRRLDDDFRNSWSEEHRPRLTLEEQERQTFIEQSITAKPSLFEHLMQQAHETFEHPQQRAMAEAIIGNFDHHGYLQTSLNEIALLNQFSEDALTPILQKIQTFEPFGVGAPNLQQSLLNQLKLQGKENTLAAVMLENHYEDLLHNRIPAISKGTGTNPQQIAEAIRTHLIPLDFHPGTSYSQLIPQPITPDIILREDGNTLHVDINDDSLPPLRLNARYRRMMEDPELAPDVKKFILKKTASLKWLLRNITQRGNTLERIAQELLKRQNTFLEDPQGKLAPMTMKEIAQALDLHESTIARAVANKYIETPRGLLPLRFFFTNAYVSEDGSSISSETVRTALTELIAQEDKAHPLSDQELSKQLTQRGFPCARRTIAKYRAELNLGNAHQRKKF